MRVRTLEEIQADEARNPPPPPVVASVPTMRDLRPGAFKSALLAIGDGLLLTPKFFVLLIRVALIAAISLGIVGLIVFGLRQLF